jgi:hypothetical protein
MGSLEWNDSLIARGIVGTELGGGGTMAALVSEQTGRGVAADAGESVFWAEVVDMAMLSAGQ